MQRIKSDRQNMLKFEMRTPGVPTPDEVGRAQIKLGYHPAGYGGPYRTTTVREANECVTTWYCSNNCD